MKFLFVTTGSSATFYAVAPLATAARNEGHDVMLAAHEPWMETVEAIGVPSVCYSPEPIRHFMKPGRLGNTGRFPRDPGDAEMMDIGRGFGRMASAGLAALLELAEDWRPDVVIGSSMSYVAALLATRLQVPYVRQVEYHAVPMDGIDPGAEEQLLPELGRLGLDGLPYPALYVDVTPPSLRPARSAAVQSMRWIASNPQHRLEPWMYTHPKGRHRVLITSGFRTPSWSMRNLVGQLVLAGAEVLISAPPEGAAVRLGAELGDVRIGWTPLDVVAPTCDLAVNHEGATTAMTTMAAGVPQLIIPPNNHMKAIAQALSGYGAAMTIEPQHHEPGEDLGEVIAMGCEEILSTPRYAQQAAALGAEIAALAKPSEVVRNLEELAA